MPLGALVAIYMIVVGDCFNFIWPKCGSNMSNTSESVLSGFPNTARSVEKMTRSGAFLDEIRGVWMRR